MELACCYSRNTWWQRLWSEVASDTTVVAKPAISLHWARTTATTKMKFFVVYILLFSLTSGIVIAPGHGGRPGTHKEERVSDGSEEESKSGAQGRCNEMHTRYAPTYL